MTEQTSLSNLGLNKISVNNAHQTQLQNGENNIDNILTLVDVLGGIDAILNEYLSNSSIQINDKKLNQIYQIITTPQQFKSKNKSMAKNNLTYIQSADGKEDLFFCYTFDENNNYLVSLFGKQSASKITYIHSRSATRIIVMVVMGTWAAIWFFIRNTLFYTIYVLVSMIFVAIPYFFIYLLLANKAALKMIVKTFEFWFKMYYVITFGIAYILDVYWVRVHYFHYKYPLLHLIGAVLFLQVWLNSIIAFVGLFDAYKLDKCFTFWSLVLLAAMLGLISIYFQLLSYSDGNVDESVITVYGNCKFSLIQIQIEALRVLSIFTWKHMILLYAKKNKAMLVKWSPFWNWTSTTNDDVNDTPNTPHMHTISTPNTTEMELNVMTVRVQPTNARKESSISSFDCNSDKLSS